jgi:hypothetical protein
MDPATLALISGLVTLAEQTIPIIRDAFKNGDIS